jgi:hypothetical protein
VNLDGVDDIHKPEDITAETVRSSIDSNGFKRLSIDSVCVRENNDCKGG